VIGSRLGLAVTGSIAQPMYPMTCGGALILRSAKGGFALLTKRDEGEAPFFDELAQGVYSGAISRREAIKLGGSALAVSALAVAALAGLFPGAVMRDIRRRFPHRSDQPFG
jgi:hypothetical protein